MVIFDVEIGIVVVFGDIKKSGGQWDRVWLLGRSYVGEGYDD